MYPAYGDAGMIGCFSASIMGGELGQIRNRWKLHYTTEKNNHGLDFNPFKAIVAPRPIGWISSLDSQGRANLAPYSFFNAFSDDPPMVGFASGPTKIDSDAPKDSPTNIEETGAFCVNFVSFELRDKMNITSGHFDHDVDEFERAGLTKGRGIETDVPFVAEAPAVFECTHFQTVDLPGGSKLILGQVRAIHISDDIILNGRIDMAAYRPLARLGYKEYLDVKETFELSRPDDNQGGL